MIQFKENIRTDGRTDRHQSETPEWFRYKVGRITTNNAIEGLYSLSGTFEETRFL